MEPPKEQAKEPEEDTTHTTSTTPTRIPYPARFQRSASMRLRGNQAELGPGPAGGGGFSSRAKLSAIKSVLLKRSWSNLGHKTEQEPEAEADPQADHALCTAAQSLSLAEDLKTNDQQVANDNMAASSKPRNLVSF